MVRLTHALPTNLLISLLLMAATNTNAIAGNLESASTSEAVATLTNQYKSLSNQLSNNQFKRPLVLNSSETAESLKGEIYAVVDYPFATVNTALNNPANWCEALILHINVKYCRVENSYGDTMLNLNLGKKYDQPLADTYKAAFNYQEITSAANYFSIKLKAKNGPLGTYDYHIHIEATPLKNAQTFLHFTYAYSFGLTSKIAMKGYLATIGRDKVGFTLISNANAEPAYIQGVRSVIERNTMRYYLAIDAYLAALNEPVANQLEQRLNNWFNHTEQYQVQLHEVERDDYFNMKRKEYKRQNEQ